MKKIEVDYGYRIIDDSDNIIKYEGGSTCQGFVYKDEQAWLSGEGICYISEYGLQDYEQELARIPEDEKPDYHKDKKSIGYTRRDFIDLCDGDEALAEELFYGVDWQYPETLLAEINY